MYLIFVKIVRFFVLIRGSSGEHLGIENRCFLIQTLICYDVFYRSHFGSRCIPIGTITSPGLATVPDGPKAGDYKPAPLDPAPPGVVKSQEEP